MPDPIVPAAERTVKDAATEAAARVMYPYVSNLNGRELDNAEEALAAAVPLILDEAARRIEGGLDSLRRTSQNAHEKGDDKFARYAAIKAEGVALALGTVRALAEEWTP